MQIFHLYGAERKKIIDVITTSMIFLFSFYFLNISISGYPFCPRYNPVILQLRKRL